MKALARIHRVGNLLVMLENKDNKQIYLMLFIHLQDIIVYQF